ncbi:hypothetical protein SARC_00563 [Sphaeroforma arctica JP610]|uniref:Uncharacterized protein n=1 Tax=Sphaeroforma arctica JP610 TaxID=667725 RepID=A0A0L0GEK9_9EUKA|nr:hypothetical protein SARC_00563 [Sphaeroforma arctica JP610]KNC87321.1 hypothetical protein SARC_00563 [Sphaeroforma arctica JP610]|eukprot:XP_014161223.1 hypothetical protein SARC_00563 [Sphaeroforma arctica JP610]
MGDEVLSWDGISVSGVDPWVVLQEIQQEQNLAKKTKHTMHIRRRPFCRLVGISFAEVNERPKPEEPQEIQETQETQQQPQHEPTASGTDGTDTTESLLNPSTGSTGEAMEGREGIELTGTNSTAVNRIGELSTHRVQASASLAATSTTLGSLRNGSVFKGLVVTNIESDESKSGRIMQKVSVFVSVHRKLASCYFSCCRSGGSMYEDCGVFVQNGVLICKEGNVALLELNGEKVVGVPDEKVAASIYRQAILHERGLASKIRAVVMEEDIYNCLFPSPSVSLYLRRYENS